ncbi:peptidoglycan amidohydrolase family protein [Acinetobacter terrestris]|uniref:peptidoglycan amidohydrolase family protein n=1 Tax=Acinetobacter terrestris TaxID=2529843 RepID=UPI003524110F
MIYDAHHSNMINAANQNTAVISQKYQDNQAGLRAKNPQKNKGIPYLDVRKFTQKLHSMSSATSTKKCARSIRIALQSAGARILNHPVAAADWGNTLQTIGYKKITPSFNNPKEGDIYIINRTQKHVYGHIAAYTGRQWVSDFRQNSHAVYKNDQVSYTYYRLA